MDYKRGSASSRPIIEMVIPSSVDSSISPPGLSLIEPWQNSVFDIVLEQESMLLCFLCNTRHTNLK